MRRTFFVSIGLAAFLAGPGLSQEKQYLPGEQPGPAVSTAETDPAVIQLKQFGNYDALKQRLKQSNNKGKSLTQLLAEDKADATALVASLKLSCSVTGGSFVAEDIKAHTKTYEVACEGGAGYFLVKSDPPGPPAGFTCFAADAARQADIAAHREPAIGCGLAENADAKKMASSVLAHAGKTCAVKDFAWRGQNATTDFVEVSCADESGYMLRLPLPGSQAPIRIDTCTDSAAKGLACRLAGNDTTLASFKAALAEHNVACDAERVRVIGREVQKRRQVVEYFCPKQQPKGLVAFLPAEGSTEPFEVLDCSAAAKHQVICTLSNRTDVLGSPVR